MRQFNLNKFKAGQKALTRDGRTVTFIATCEECSTDSQLIVLIEGKHKCSTCGLDGKYTKSTTQTDDYDLVSMVPRHQALIDAYDPEDTWQVLYDETIWELVHGNPIWSETSDYRIHPHNSLIKAHKEGAKIESYIAGEWVEESTINWSENTQYRIKPKSKITKTVYEWLWRDSNGHWFTHTPLLTEERAKKHFGKSAYAKTGRSWEVDV